MKPILSIAALLGVVLATGAFAQGNSGAENLSATDRGGSTGNGASVAQVGAGTTNGSTTGFSGPKSTVGSRPKPQLPALPSAALCSSYKDQPFHQHCLAKVAPRSGAPNE